MIEESTEVNRTVAKLDNTDCDEYMCNTRHLYGVKTRIVNKTSFLGIKTLNKDVDERIYCPKHQGDSLELVNQARNEEHEDAKQKLKEHRRQQNDEEIDKLTHNSVLPVFIFSHGSIERPNDDNFSIEVDNFKKAIGILERCSNKHPIFLYHRYNPTYSIIKSGCMNGSEFKEYGLESKIIAEDIEEEYGDNNFNQYEYQILRSNEITGQKVPDKMYNINQFKNVDFSNGNIYDEDVFRLDISNCPVCDNAMWTDYEFVRLKLHGDIQLIVIHNDRNCNKIIGEVNPIFCGEENYAPIK